MGGANGGKDYYTGDEIADRKYHTTSGASNNTRRRGLGGIDNKSSKSDNSVGRVTNNTHILSNTTSPIGTSSNKPSNKNVTMTGNMSDTSSSLTNNNYNNTGGNKDKNM